MRLSVLDQSGIASGQSPAAAIRETIGLAKACEAYGYARYWVSEHHSNRALAGSAPEVLLGALAMATRTIRIGAAGMLLPHYAPLKVAEQFRVLEALAPGRIDLGIGRGPGADKEAAFALKPGLLDNPLAGISMGAVDRFPEAVADLVAWATGTALPDGHPFERVVAQPTGPTAPRPWIVGSSPYTAELAAWLGLPYCFAYFFHDGRGAAEALDAYRAAFQPSAHLAAPKTSLCVWAIAADSAEKAEALFDAYALSRIEQSRGTVRAFPSADEVAQAHYSERERAAIAFTRDQVPHGTPDLVVQSLRKMAESFGVDEIVITSMSADPADRADSYRLIAEAAELCPPGQAENLSSRNRAA